MNINENIITILPPNISNIIVNTVETSKLNEIRIRKDKKIVLNLCGKLFYLSSKNIISWGFLLYLELLVFFAALFARDGKDINITVHETKINNPKKYLFKNNTVITPIIKNITVIP